MSHGHFLPLGCGKECADMVRRCLGFSGICSEYKLKNVRCNDPEKLGKWYWVTYLYPIRLITHENEQVEFTLYCVVLSEELTTPLCWEITECSSVHPAAPAEPVLAAVAALVQEEGTWKGTAMELVEALQNREPELKIWPNTLSRKLRTTQLQKDFGIRLTQSRNQNGKYLELSTMTDMSDGGG